VTGVQTCALPIYGNTLITGSTVIVEVTPDGKVVWQLRLKAVFTGYWEPPGRGFYKAERLGSVP
jgi:hypothetical protein